jgi:hypothetical protein
VTVKRTAVGRPGVGSDWVEIARVASDSEPGKDHAIKRHASAGILWCDCMAYRFARGVKTCKHIEALGQVADRQVAVAARGRQTSDVAVVGAERFTVRRALNLGGSV